MARGVKILSCLCGIVGFIMFLAGLYGFESGSRTIFQQLGAGLYMIVALMIVFGALYFNKLYGKKEDRYNHLEQSS